jgi:hypothetical protein
MIQYLTYFVSSPDEVISARENLFNQIRVCTQP